MIAFNEMVGSTYYNAFIPAPRVANDYVLDDIERHQIDSKL